jgi:hypothetical protein
MDNYWVIRGCDFSGCTAMTSLFDWSTTLDENTRIYIEDCLYPAGVTTLEAATTFLDMHAQVIETYHTQIGTDADPSYQGEKITAHGICSVDVARYRTAGSSDGERATEYSMDMQTTFGHIRQFPQSALESFPLAVWSAGDGATEHTYTVYIASGGTLTDADIWVVLWIQSDAATNSLAQRISSQAAPLATPTNITTDSASTWNGTDVSTKQKIVLSHTPDKPGVVRGHVYLVKNTERVSVDAAIWVDE